MTRKRRMRGQWLLASVLLAVSLGLVTVAQRDLSRRAVADVRGDKRLWRLVCLNAIGAVAYLWWGRPRGH